MEVRYKISQSLQLRGNATGGDVSVTEITSGNADVSWDAAYTYKSNIACLKFTPTRNSNNLSVAFKINITFAQNKTGEYWCCTVSDKKPESTKISVGGEGMYFKFGLNGGNYGIKTESFTFSGDFKAGKIYWLIVGMASYSSKNTASLIDPNSIVLTAEPTSGNAYIWTTKDTESEEITSSIEAGDTWRSLESWDSGAWKKAGSAGIGNSTIVGIGVDNGTLHYNATCIPLGSVNKRVQSVTITFPIVWNSSGTHIYRWAVSTVDRSTAYIKTMSEVSESGQLASGEFNDYSGSTNTYTFNVDIPANTSVYLYLWSHESASGAKKYGNFHMSNTISITKKTMSESGMGWVGHTPYIFMNSSWEAVTPYIFDNGEWKEAI